MNSSNYRIFKCIGFVSSHFVGATNLDVAPFSSVFSEFDYVSQLDVLLV